MLYALNETQANASMISISEIDAKAYNVKKFGIFRTVNSFNGARKIDNLAKINAWYVEIDGDKPSQLLKIKDSPIYPSRVVESKNGYHIYFNAIDASKETYAEIQDGLREYYGGDHRAKDLARVLREPGFYHWKDEASPYLVKELFRADIRYREKDMLHFFPKTEEKKTAIPVELEKRSTSLIDKKFDGLTDFLNRIDNEDALSRLSGTRFVYGEVYTFKEQSGGKKNILVNGKSTSCFIDDKKRIGATPGGPTIFQWLRYFGHQDNNIYVILKSIYPEANL